MQVCSALQEDRLMLNISNLSIDGLPMVTHGMFAFPFALYP